MSVATSPARIVTVFRSRLRDNTGDEYRQTAARMEALARGMPGFVSFKAFTADDDERVSIIEFDSMEAQRAWREHPEHRAAQSAGREKFYECYSLQVCELVREQSFTV